MKYYAQEARRNHVTGFTWYACEKFKDKQSALCVETGLCRSLKPFSLPKHREWVRGSASDFDAIINGIIRLRVELADESEDCGAIAFGGSHGTYGPYGVPL